MKYIGFIAAGNGEPDQLARTIADQMQLRIQPAFGLADGAPCVGLFCSVGSNAAGFDVCCIKHECVQSALFCANAANVCSKNTGLGPAFVTVVKDLGRSVFGRHIAPVVTALQAEDNARKHAAVINPRNITGLVRQQWFDGARIVPQ